MQKKNCGNHKNHKKNVQFFLKNAQILGKNREKMYKKMCKECGKNAKRISPPCLSQPFY